MTRQAEDVQPACPDGNQKMVRRVRGFVLESMHLLEAETTMMSSHDFDVGSTNLLDGYRLRWHEISIVYTKEV